MDKYFDVRLRGSEANLVKKCLWDEIERISKDYWKMARGRGHYKFSDSERAMMQAKMMDMRHIVAVIDFYRDREEA